MRNQNVHVVQKDGQWAVEEEGKSDKPMFFPTKEEAVESGRQLAEEKQVELLVHRADGAITERDSYGNDPRDVPG